METKLYEINVTLSREQKEDICEAFFDRKKISLYLNNCNPHGDNALYGDDTLLVPEKSIEWDIDHFVSDEETFSETFEWHQDHYMLTKKTFSEMLENNFLLIPSINDKGLKNFLLFSPPTVVKRLEEARVQNIPCLKIFLDYSLLNNSTHSIQYSVFKNLEKMMENIIEK